MHIVSSVNPVSYRFKTKGELGFVDGGADGHIQRKVIQRRGRECGYPMNSSRAYISSVSLKKK